MSTQKDTYDEVTATLVEVFGFSPEKVTPDARLVEDLDLDSIDAIDMAVRIEDRLGFEFTRPDLRAVKTVKDIVDLIHARRGEHASAPASGTSSRME